MERAILDETLSITDAVMGVDGHGGFAVEVAYSIPRWLERVRRGFLGL